jgi:pimeloyl-ACP methyl ester carboxylesterase
LVCPSALWFITGDGTIAQTTASAAPVILFSGIAADDSLVAFQKLAFPQIVVPVWPQPMERESLRGYCERLANDLRPLGASVIGGVSFGGIIALQVAEFLKPQRVILIGSVRGPSELPFRIRALRFFLFLMPFIPIAWMQWLARAVPGWSAIFASVVRQFRQADPQTLRWSIRQILTWNHTPQVDCPVEHIHGSRDFVFPIGLTKPTSVIPGGGHLISLTRSKQVNAFLAECLAQQEP